MESTRKIKAGQTEASGGGGNSYATIPDASSVKGDIVFFGTGTTVAGSLYYFSTAGVWTACNASTSGNSLGVLAIAVGTSPGTNGMLIRGLARFASSPYTSMTLGQILYATTVAGNFSGTAPSASNQIVRVIGYCVDATNDVIYFNPDNTWITLI